MENKHQWRKNPNESFSYISPLIAIFHVVFLLKKGGKMISTQADSICLTFHWENYWNSDKMKWEDIEFLFYSNREPLPYVTRLQRALTVATAFHRLKLIEYPYLAMNYPLFLWWSETEASWKSIACEFTQRHIQRKFNTLLYFLLCIILFSGRWTITRPHTPLYYTKIKVLGMVLTALSYSSFPLWFFFFFFWSYEIKCCSF